MADEVLGQFTSGMDRRSRRGGKNGATQLYTLINGYIDAKKQVVPRPGLNHVANVPNSVGLYGYDGTLHVFHSGDEGFVDPGNPLVTPHIIRYPIDPEPYVPPVVDAYGEVILADDPIFYLPLSDSVGTSAVDLTGNGHTGQYIGGYAHSDVALRTGGRSLKLPLTTSDTVAYAIVPDDGWSEMLGTDNWTLEAIAMKPTGSIVNTSNFGYVLMKYITLLAGTQQGALKFVGSGDTSGLAASLSDSAGHQYEASIDGWEFDQAYMLHCVRDGDHLLLYVNGDLAAISSPIDAYIFTQNTNPLCIGGTPDYPISYNFQGYISDVAGYDHTLSAERVLAHAQAAGLHA